MSAPFDLASLAKPLVTAPLALAFLDLDADRRGQLGFHDRAGRLTVRQLLSHSSGLPPWRPFTGEPVAAQLRRPVPDHPLLRPGAGPVTYSDLNYRLLAELLAQETGVPFAVLARTAGLSAAPWDPAPPGLPDAPDAEAWALATELPLAAQAPGLPHDANARMGMEGHAGFAATAPQLRAALTRWVGAGWPGRMAVDTALAADGARWGLGLQQALDGPGRFGALLARLPLGLGVRVLEDATDAVAEPAPPQAPAPGAATDWWCHTGYTGPALFVRPADGACVALLLRRRGPAGELLDLAAMHARRWAALARFVEEWGR